MRCSDLREVLDRERGPELQARLEQHLVACTVCQDELEASMQLHALGAELSRRPDRPRPPRRGELHGPIGLSRRTRRVVAGVALVVVMLVAVVGLTRRPDSRSIAGELLAQRARLERLPYAELDRYRPYDTARGDAARDWVPAGALDRLAARDDTVGLVAAHLVRGELDDADEVLAGAGPGDELDVERALVEARRGRQLAALALLDRVLARRPDHVHALWNRAEALVALGLPHSASEAFATVAARAADPLDPGWTIEAIARSRELFDRELQRIAAWRIANAACAALAERGVVPELELVRRNASVCRPALLEAVRRAASRDDVVRLRPVAEVLDDELADRASSQLVDRAAAADFARRGPAVAAYRALTAPGRSAGDRARLVAELRASGQDDLMIGALPWSGPPDDYLDEYLARARATGDPYLIELVARSEARAARGAGNPWQAEQLLRDAVARCSARAVELRCAYLYLELAKLYADWHRPSEARAIALDGLARSRRLGLYWDERLLFNVLADAARLARDGSQMRAYAREAALRTTECLQQRMSFELIADAELAELRHREARAALDAVTCAQPPSLAAARIEADLAQVERDPVSAAKARAGLARIRAEDRLTPGEQVYLAAIEARLAAVADPAAARAQLARAIADADALGGDDVTAVKARAYAYEALLVLGADDLAGPAQLALFAAAAGSQLRPGCALGALIDGDRLVVAARTLGGAHLRVNRPHALAGPDFDARTLVPRDVVDALAGCARIDVLALPPLYGQPRLLPGHLAWSYRGPAAPVIPAAGRRPRVVTVEDVRPPAPLGLPALRSPPRGARGGADELVISGDQATPARVGRELARADLVEIHAHGFVDVGISDVALIALSPDADGSFALTARAIAELRLARAPFVALAACHAAEVAPYLHEPWSLPYAFLRAGARGVLAPTRTIPDRAAGELFRAFGDRLLAGDPVDPAVVLRDLRLQPRAVAADWIDDLVLFD